MRVQEGERYLILRLVLQPVPDADAARFVVTCVEHLALRLTVFALRVDKGDRRAERKLVVLGRAAVAPAEGRRKANLRGRLDQMDALVCELAGDLPELADAVQNPE